MSVRGVDHPHPKSVEVKERSIPLLPLRTIVVSSRLYFSFYSLAHIHATSDLLSPVQVVRSDVTANPVAEDDIRPSLSHVSSIYVGTG